MNVRQGTTPDSLQPKGQDAVLVFVAFHPGPIEVERLASCLKHLSPRIVYAIVSNEHRDGEPIEALRTGAACFITNRHNPGYGRAVNQAVAELKKRGVLPAYIGALNTDLAWEEGCFERLLDWLFKHQDVVLAVPKLVDREGVVQHLCKPDPTLLGLFSRRFIPERLKPTWVKQYDLWYVMAQKDYNSVLDVPYLSGCCMLMKSKTFLNVGGFDERFFLYLEDADITRAFRSHGRTIHLPITSVVHHWGRGNHKNHWLTLVNFHSAWVYFNKWGWRFK
jgi:GT2 family glycosyltransferase